VFDWVVPQEWNIRDAWVKNVQGDKVIDFQQHCLHILNYSIPIHKKVSLDELKKHVYTLPEFPNWIPHRTSYYAPNWGFCMQHNDLLKLEPGEYEVMIDSSLEDGYMTYGEYFLPGETSDEVLISCHSCHPSLCNDNLSGVTLGTMLAKVLSGIKLRLSYRFLFIPGTLGSITWLAINEAKVANIKHGMVVATVGDAGHMHYKKTRRGDAEIDLAVLHVLQHSGEPYDVREFSPYGYDERQFSSPGFNLPVGSLTRTPHGRFDEYHTSGDDLEFVRPEYLTDSLDKYLSVIEVLEGNKKYMNKNPKCEPQLGKRGLYGVFGGRVDQRNNEMALLWVFGCEAIRRMCCPFLTKSSRSMPSGSELWRPPSGS
jgi:aminopeptidase-like protein